MASAISLANQALLKLGATRINTFEDTKIEAVVIKEFYEPAYLWMLAQYPWSFAMKSQTLARTITPPDEEYEYGYALPEDFVWIQRTFPISNFKIVGRELHTNEQKIAIKYSQRIDESRTPPTFAQAFMLYLASLACITITENTQKEQSLATQAMDHLKRAKSLDAQQHPQDGFQEFPLDSARYGSGGGAGWGF